MTSSKEEFLQPTTLKEALNIIKFLTTSHKQEISKLNETHKKQQSIIKKLQMNRKKELEFLSGELQKYEINLALRTETVNKQLAEKDNIIKKQLETIEELTRKLAIQESLIVPEINIIADSNSDSGVAMDMEESSKIHEGTIEAKTSRKCSKRFADSISFLRRVDFSPMKHKPCSTESAKKKEEPKSKNLNVPINRRFFRQFSNDRPTSDDERAIFDDAVLSDSPIEPIILRPKQMNDSMNNHFSDDGSEDTSEEQFDRVMTRSSFRRSVKANPKYKKISRSKGKLLENIKVNIVD